MKQDFHGYKFFVLIDEGRNRTVRKIVASQGLERDMAALFEEQANAFLDASYRKIAFDPRYKADSDDLFEIQDFEMSDVIKAAAVSSAQVEGLTLSPNDPPVIKAIVAAKNTGTSTDLRLLFQKFDRRRLLKPGSILTLHKNGTFQKLDDPGITLDNQLTAAFENGALYFRSYAAVSSFLDLTNYFVEATDRDISSVISHASLSVTNSDALLGMCDTHIRRKISVIKLSGILDKTTPRSIVARAREWDMKIDLKSRNGNDQFLLPTDKKELKRFLTFLCEGYFKGALTEERYETNSHRKLPGSTG